MIAFDLQCANGHKFEGWFDDSRAYEEQSARGLVTCPVCSDQGVTKLMSTFAIKSATPPAREGAPTKAALSALHGEIVDFMKNNFDDVGSNFTKEALKIHYGVTEPRNIRGVSTQEEEVTLKAEGVEFFKIPVPSTPDTDT